MTRPMHPFRRHTALAVLAAWCWSATAAALSGGTTLLYDGALATSPGAQGWFSVVPPAPFASQTLAGGGVTLDTSFLDATQAGYALAPLFGNGVTLDSGAGFRLSFTARVEAEAHANDNRAGFSMIVLDGAHRGVELGFWTTRVFAQDLAGASFVQAAAPERADLVTTGFADYSLLVHAGNYALSVNGAPVFSGALRDYSPSGVTVAGVAVYAQPDFLFFGDDTGSAAARMHLRSVSVAPVPEPSIAAMMLAGLGAVGYAIRRRRHRQGGTARPGS